jgi:hypothetical protein
MINIPGTTVLDRLVLFKPVPDVHGGTMEAIHEGPDWNGMHIFQVKLLTYSDGSMDIHRQTGENYQKDMAEAEKILLARDLMIDPTDEGMIGSSGLYRRVVKKFQGDNL